MGLVKHLIVPVVAASMLLFASASIAATPADTAATHALLEARYAYYVALIDNAPATRASTATLVAGLGRECHGVLAGEPSDEIEGGPPESPPPTPRVRGERQRAERQSQTISSELRSALGFAEASPDRPAIEAYAAATAPLSWSDARVAPLVHEDTTRLQESVTVAPPDVCTDMKAWAQSGYRLLSPASRAFQAAQTARADRIEPGESLAALLAPSEGASERALLARTAALRTKLLSILEQTARTASALQRAFGVPESPSEERLHAPVLGHGKTRSGGTFTVRRDTSKEPFGPPCRHQVSIELSERPSRGHGGTGTSICLSDRKDRRPSGSCGGGEASITALVSANVRTVRLRLSDGRTVTSGVVRIPAKDGGPAGVYVQAIRGYTPYPVSLTELDRHGNVVRVVSARDIRCRKEPDNAGPTFVSLISGTVPGGQPFSIQGVLVKFGHNQHDFSLIASVVGNETTGEEATNEESTGENLIGHRSAPKAFPWSLTIGCPPRQFALVYGILAAPGDSVLARTPEGLVPLAKYEIAPNVDSGGPLLYGAFSSLPSELIVRRSDGSTLYSENLAAKASEDAQFCEGLAEG